MSKHHQANRRRTYGRRQHELHERTERYVGVLGWIDESALRGPGDRWGAERSARTTVGEWPPSRGVG